MSWTPRDFLVEDLAYVAPKLYYHYPGSQALMTAGMEVEQEPDEVRRCLDYGALTAYEWHLDASGPLETALPPKLVYTFEIKRFFREVEECYVASGKWFRWTNEFREGALVRGCGSHLHFRPREDVEMVKKGWPDSWRVAYDTIMSVSLIILPTLCFGRECRLRLWTWASYYSGDYPPISRSTVEHYLRDNYVGHPYSWLAWNRRTYEKPLTLELRVFEGHPAQALLAISLIQKAVKVAIQNDFTPVLFEDEAYDDFRIEISTRAEELRHVNVYDLLKMAKPRFRPEYWMPYVPKRDYADMLELFREVLFNYTTRSPPYMRVAALLALGGDIKKNYPVYWRVFDEEGRFCWDDPHICDDEIERMFESEESFWNTIGRHGVV